MDKIGVKLDALVYVKKMNDIGLWPDEDTCDPERINLDRPMLKMAGAGVAREVAAYHRDRDPLGEADFLFVRIVPS